MIDSYLSKTTIVRQRKRCFSMFSIFPSSNIFLVEISTVLQLSSVSDKLPSTKYCDVVTEPKPHYNDVIMSTIASQVTSLTIVYSTVYSGADQIKHQSSASLAFVRGIHRGPVNSPHKGPVTRNMFPFDDVIMLQRMTNLKTLWRHTM